MESETIPDAPTARLDNVPNEKIGQAVNTVEQKAREVDVNATAEEQADALFGILDELPDEVEAIVRDALDGALCEIVEATVADERTREVIGETIETIIPLPGVLESLDDLVIEQVIDFTGRLVVRELCPNAKATA